MGSVDTASAELHWSYSLMANALLLFLVHPRVEGGEMARLTRYVMSCLLGDLKVLRLPAVCVLLMVGSGVLPVHTRVQSACLHR